MKIFQEFKEFAVRGNVVDLAVGLILGVAFNAIVQSFVTDVVTPPIGYFFDGTDFNDLFFLLGEGQYDTLAAAQEAGAVTINHGAFLNTIIAFLLTALAVFFLVKGINRLRRKKDAGETPAPTEKTCPFCMSTIALSATRCPNCTSELPEENPET